MYALEKALHTFQCMLLKRPFILSSDAKKYHNWDFRFFITYTVDNPLFEALNMF
jgi:hypothetical protein